jgi:hypothetical protein
MEDLKQVPKAIIYVFRIRYQRDPLSRKTPSYTEYKLLVDGVDIFIRQAGNSFKNVNQFKKWCLQTKKCQELGVTEIIVNKPLNVQLGFCAQR